MPMKDKPVRLFIATPCYGGNLHYQFQGDLWTYFNAGKPQHG